MAAQLVSTLTSTLVRAARDRPGRSMLEVNGRVRTITGRQVLQPAPVRAPRPDRLSTGRRCTSSASSRRDQRARPGDDKPQPVQKPAGHGQPPFALIAVSGHAASPQFAGAREHRPAAASSTTDRSPGLPRCTTRRSPIPQRAVHLGRAGTATATSGPWPATRSGCCSPAAPAADRAYRVPPLPGGGPPLPGAVAAGGADGVRAAMLISVQDGTRKLGADGHRRQRHQHRRSARRSSVGPALTDPVALSWYDADHLVVLSRSQLYEVPVNGGAPIAGGPGTGRRPVTAAGPRPGRDGRRRRDADLDRPR